MFDPHIICRCGESYLAHCAGLKDKTFHCKVFRPHTKDIKPERSSLTATVYPKCECGAPWPLHPRAECPAYSPTKPIVEIATDLLRTDHQEG